jgi:ABC-type glycerol-3-phosphate transport system permease component
VGRSRGFTAAAAARVVQKAAVHLLLALLSITALFPVYFMTVNSLKSGRDFLYNKFGPPAQLRLANFIDAFRGGGNLLRWFFNSVSVTSFTLALSTVCTLMAAYAFVYCRFKGRNLQFNLVVSLMVFPPVIIIIPLFMFLQSIGLVNSHLGVILIYSGLVLPFGIYLIAKFFATVPTEIVESARIDGAATRTILLRLLVPLASPAIVTLVVVNALFIWNELLVALVFLQREKTMTLMAGLMSFKSRFRTDMTLIMAGLTIICAPIILLYLSSSRYFIKGLTAGSLKG